MVIPSVRRMILLNSRAAGQRGSVIRMFLCSWGQVLKDVFRNPTIMGVGYRWFGRPLLRFQDSEKAHGRSLSLLRLASSNPITRLALRVLYKPRVSLPVELFGYRYNHPFGLAAGMDKNAKALRGWEATGLSFVEIGGVTMLEQGGNPKPRMFRAPHAQALVNRMGFNNDGSEKIQLALERHIKRHGRLGIPVWVNLGKSKITPLDEAHLDYGATLASSRGVFYSQ